LTLKTLIRVRQKIRNCLQLGKNIWHCTWRRQYFLYCWRQFTVW